MPKSANDETDQSFCKVYDSARYAAHTHELSGKHEKRYCEQRKRVHARKRLLRYDSKRYIASYHHYGGSDANSYSHRHAKQEEKH